MYRRHLAIKRKMAEDAQFVTKVANIPAVVSAMNTVTDLYQKTKDRSDLLNYTLTAAETGVKTVAGRAQPLISKYEEPFKKVNDYACQKLDELTTTYPVISKPTDELISESKEACGNLIQPAVATVTAIKDLGVGAYNTVNGVKQYGIDTVVGAASYGKDTVVGAANYGKETVIGAANYSKDTVTSVTNYGKEQLSNATSYGQSRLNDALNTSTGQILTDKLANVLSASEDYVDKYLPPLDGSEDEPEEVDDADMLGRVSALRTKLQRRTVRRALKQLVDVKVRSKDLLDKLGMSLNMVAYARQNIDTMISASEGVGAQIGGTVTAAGSKFMDMWAEIMAEGEETCDETAESLERRSVTVARHLIIQLRTTITSLQSNLSHLPTAARTKYTELHKYSEDLVTAFKNVKQASDISDWMVAQTRETIGHIQTTLTSMLDLAVASPPINWIVNKAWGPTSSRSQMIPMEVLVST